MGRSYHRIGQIQRPASHSILFFPPVFSLHSPLFSLCPPLTPSSSPLTLSSSPLFSLYSPLLSLVNTQVDNMESYNFQPRTMLSEVRTRSDNFTVFPFILKVKQNRRLPLHFFILFLLLFPFTPVKCTSLFSYNFFSSNLRFCLYLFPSLFSNFFLLL